MRSLIFGTAFALVVALGAAGTALAGSIGWGDASNGNGYYHESNGASTGWGDTSNGYGYYHESNGKAAPHKLDASKNPTQPSSN